MHWTDDDWLVYRLGDEQDIIEARWRPWDLTTWEADGVRQGHYPPSDVPRNAFQYARHDRFAAAQLVLESELNRAMRDAEFRLSLERTDKGTLRAVPVPRNLNSCIWLQVARGTSGETEFWRRTDGVYEVVDDLKSEDPLRSAELSAKRSKDYRKRKRDTKQKLRDGVPPEDIVRQMMEQGSKKETVEKWIAEAQKASKK